MSTKSKEQNFKYKVSVIVPIYNGERYIENCVNSVMNEQGNRDDYEVILVNDGSKDNSAAICDEMAKKYPNIKVIHKENETLSPTRNRGIRESEGKYFLFLDVDDTILPHTIDKLIKFFDKHYDEVDLVTYPQIDILRDGTLRKHFRFDIMKKSGVYDLTINPYITQTRVNVIVKNKGQGNNVLFDETPGFRHEDSCYNAYVLMDKMKIGFCNEGGYVYALNNDNITANYFYAYYIFETATKYYENLFAEFKESKVPKYFQSLVLNDLSWKLRSNKFLPYHYEKEDLEHAFDRICKIVQQMDDEIILNHPDVDTYHKHFFLSLKKGNYEIETDDDCCMLLHEGKVLATWRTFGINVQKIKLNNGKFRIYAAAKHPISIYREMKVWVQENDDSATLRQMETTDSTYSYNRAKIKTANFRRFVYECDVNQINKIQFFIEVDGTLYETRFSNTMNAPFDNGVGKKSMIRDRILIRFETEAITVKALNDAEYEQELRLEEEFHKDWNPELWKERKRISRDMSQKNVWLYYDANTNIENGLLQFRYDRAQNDGVERYYVYDNELSAIEHHFTEEEKKYLVQFGSDKHKELFHRAAKILTAYAQLNYYCPYPNNEVKYFSDLWNYEVVYLQHGILHATLPWQYGNDRVALDKIIVSSNFEKENMINKYCFREEEIIDSGMVRFDYIDKTKKPKNRILIAPSWRHYLIGDIRNNRWTPQIEKFLKSDYFNKYMELFNSDHLKQLLEDNDLYLDFKLHPIFELYKDEFKIENPRITLAESAVDLADYKICITDFSSFVFDFVYCNKPVLYFMPDYYMFKSGMHTYRELDIPLEDGFGKLAIEPEDLVRNIEEIIQNNFEIPMEYRVKTDHFFTYYDNHAKRTYEAIKGEE